MEAIRDPRTLNRHGRRRAGLNPPFQPVEITVPCRGELHTIRVDKHGRFVVLNHTSEQLQREPRLGEIGGKPCRCARLFRLWRRVMEDGHGYFQLPKPLRAAARQAIVRRDLRHIDVDPLLREIAHEYIDLLDDDEVL